MAALSTTAQTVTFKLSDPAISSISRMMIAFFARSSEPVTYINRDDVLISSIGYGSIGKIQVFDKPGKYGTVSEVTIIRQNRLNPHYIVAFLRSKAGQYQIDRLITGATGQLHLYPRDVAKIFVPLLHSNTQHEFQTIADEVRQQRQRGRELLIHAERILLSVLGPTDWTPPEPLAYSATFADVLCLPNALSETPSHDRPVKQLGSVSCLRARCSTQTMCPRIQWCETTTSPMLCNRYWTMKLPRWQRKQ